MVRKRKKRREIADCIERSKMAADCTCTIILCMPMAHSTSGELDLCLPQLLSLFLLLQATAWGVIVVDYHLMKSTLLLVEYFGHGHTIFRSG